MFLFPYIILYRHIKRCCCCLLNYSINLMIRRFLTFSRKCFVVFLLEDDDAMLLLAGCCVAFIHQSGRERETEERIPGIFTMISFSLYFYFFLNIFDDFSVGVHQISFAQYYQICGQGWRNNLRNQYRYRVRDAEKSTFNVVVFSHIQRNIDEIFGRISQSKITII